MICKLTHKSLSRLASLAVAMVGLAIAGRAAEATVANWNNFSTPFAGRYQFAAAACSGVTVVFGGFDGSQALGDTWLLSGQTWIPAAIGDPERPSPRWGAAMACDEATNTWLLFGGTANGTSPLADDATYRFDGASWTRLDTPGSPRRYFHALAYDSDTQQFTLVGGIDGTGVKADTWRWNGSQWTVQATSGITARRGLGLAYDTFKHRLVLYGGGAGFNVTDDAFELKSGSNTWTPICTNCTGAGRVFHAMAFDPKQHGVVLFGGQKGPTFFNDAWLLSGFTSTKIPAAGQTPSARSGHALAYSVDRTILIGGASGSGPVSDVTWETIVSGNPCATTATECSHSSCVDGVCCKTSCSEDCRRCDTTNGNFVPPVQDGVCRPFFTDNTDCRSTSRECVGKCVKPGQCQYPGTTTRCGSPQRCLACNPMDGKCDQMPFDHDDPQCTPPPGTPAPACSDADISCRTYGTPAPQRRCLAVRECGWRWTDCDNYITNNCDFFQ